MQEGSTVIKLHKKNAALLAALSYVISYAFINYKGCSSKHVNLSMYILRVVLFAYHMYTNFLTAIPWQGNDLVIFIILCHIIDESFYRNQLCADLIMEQISRTHQWTIILHAQWFYINTMFTATT